MNERESQADLILKHLQAGNSLTVFQAMFDPFRCMALSQRCGELKRQGHPIVTRMVKLPSGKRVAQYTLEARA